MAAAGIIYIKDKIHIVIMGNFPACKHLFKSVAMAFAVSAWLHLQVVMGGLHCFASSVPSKPTTATSFGTLYPCRLSTAQTVIAIISLAQIIALGTCPLAIISSTAF